MTKDELVEQLAPHLPVEDKGATVLQAGIVATLYFEGGHTSSKKEAVVSCVDAFLDTYGDHMEWVLLGEGRPRDASRVDPDATAKYLKRCDNRDPWQDWQVDWHSAPFDQASDFGIDVFGQSQKESELHGQLSHLSVHLPLELIDEVQNEFPGLVLRWADGLSAVHGTCGLGIIKATDRFVAARTQQAEYAIAQRFPFLEVDYPVSHSLWTKKGIKGGNWLTVLSNRYAQELGGADAIGAKLGEGFSVQSGDNGVLIRAGQSLTALADSAGVSLFRTLSAVLKPIRISMHPGIHSGPMRIDPGAATAHFDKTEFEAWLSRFD